MSHRHPAGRAAPRWRWSARGWSGLDERMAGLGCWSLQPRWPCVGWGDGRGSSDRRGLSASSSALPLDIQDPLPCRCPSAFPAQAAPGDTPSNGYVPCAAALQTALPHKCSGVAALSSLGTFGYHTAGRGSGWPAASGLAVVEEEGGPGTAHPCGQREAGPGAGVSPSVCEMWQPVKHISSSKWLPVIMCCCCVLCCGWDPWLGRIPSFKGKQNKMSLLVLKESAIINMICLVFKVRDVPKSLCQRSWGSYGRDFSQGWFACLVKLGWKPGSPRSLCQALMPRLLAFNLCHLCRQYQSYQIILPQCEPLKKKSARKSTCQCTWIKVKNWIKPNVLLWFLLTRLSRYTDFGLGKRFILVQWNHLRTYQSSHTAVFVEAAFKGRAWIVPSIDTWCFQGLETLLEMGWAFLLSISQFIGKELSLLNI